jgi:hypothetical protein
MTLAMVYQQLQGVSHRPRFPPGIAGWWKFALFPLLLLGGPQSGGVPATSRAAVLFVYLLGVWSASYASDRLFRLTSGR